MFHLFDESYGFCRLLHTWSEDPSGAIHAERGVATAACRKPCLPDFFVGTKPPTSHVRVTIGCVYLVQHERFKGLKTHCESLGNNVLKRKNNQFRKQCTETSHEPEWKTIKTDVYAWGRFSVRWFFTGTLYRYVVIWCGALWSLCVACVLAATCCESLSSCGWIRKILSCLAASFASLSLAFAGGSSMARKLRAEVKSCIRCLLKSKVARLFDG